MRALYVSALALFFAISSLLYLFRFASIGAIVEPQVLGDSTSSVDVPSDLIEKVMIDEINALRSGVNLDKLSYSLDLKSLTNFRVSDMGARNYYKHKTPDGYTYANYMSEYNIESSHSCENLQLQVGDDHIEAVKAWVDSTSHYRCLTDPKNTKVAISYSPHGEPSFDSNNLPRQMYVFAMIASN